MTREAAASHNRLPVLVLNVAALISLPSLGPEATLFVVVLLALLAVIVGGRAVLTWQGLSGRSAEVRRTHARLLELEAEMPGEFDRLRTATHRVDRGVERALWSLPSLDRRIAVARASLVDERAALERSRGDVRTMAGTIARIRGTLRVLRRTRELRRTILG